MNKVFFGCLLGILTATAAFAKGSDSDFKKNELRGGVGFLSSNELISTYSDLLSTSLTGGNYSVSNEKTPGNFTLAYRYGLNKRLSLGSTFAYSLLKSDVNFNGSKTGTSTNNYFTFAPEVEYKYLYTKNFRLYGFAGAGLTLNRQEVKEYGKVSTDYNPFFNFQVTPLGVQLGNKFGLYVEAGFGYNGIINAGLFAKF